MNCLINFKFTHENRAEIGWINLLIPKDTIFTILDFNKKIKEIYSNEEIKITEIIKIKSY